VIERNKRVRDLFEEVRKMNAKYNQKEYLFIYAYNIDEGFNYEEQGLPLTM
jgi:hypothetical protein